MRYEKTACFILGLLWAFLFIVILKATAAREAKMDQLIKAGEYHAYVVDRAAHSDERFLKQVFMFVILAVFILGNMYFLNKCSHRPWWLYLLIASVCLWPLLVELYNP